MWRVRTQPWEEQGDVLNVLTFMKAMSGFVGMVVATATEGVHILLFRYSSFLYI